MAISEIRSQEVSPLYTIIVKEEKIKKILGNGFINGQDFVLAITEKPRFVEIFPGMLGSFLLPIPSEKEKKFINILPRK